MPVSHLLLSNHSMKSNENKLSVPIWPTKSADSFELETQKKLRRPTDMFVHPCKNYGKILILTCLILFNVSQIFFCYLRPNFSDTNKIVRLFWRKKSKKLTNKKVGSLCIKPASEMIKKGTLKKRKKGRVTLNKNRVLLGEELIFSPKNRAIFEIWKKDSINSFFGEHFQPSLLFLFLSF